MDTFFFIELIVEENTTVKIGPYSELSHATDVLALVLKINATNVWRITEHLLIDTYLTPMRTILSYPGPSSETILVKELEIVK